MSGIADKIFFSRHCHGMTRPDYIANLFIESLLARYVIHQANTIYQKKMYRIKVCTVCERLPKNRGWLVVKIWINQNMQIQTFAIQFHREYIKSTEPAYQSSLLIPLLQILFNGNKVCVASFEKFSRSILAACYYYGKGEDGTCTYQTTM